jgi:molybdopterin-binding protein
MLLPVPRRKRVTSPRNVLPGIYPKTPTCARAVFAERQIIWSNSMKISARNQIKGKIIEVKKGATTAHVRVEIAPGQVITSSITNEAVDDLGLKVGGTAVVVIKASNVMIAVE